MFEVIYMKADYEPWWMFEDWEEYVQLRKCFLQASEAEMYLAELLCRLRAQHAHEEQRKHCFYAFWSSEEKVFCEGCDDHLQIFHGIFVLELDFVDVTMNRNNAFIDMKGESTHDRKKLGNE